jgi:hypothetical protein
MNPPVGRQVGDVWEQDIDEILSEWTSGDGGAPGEWEGVLAGKRCDPWYPEVVESIRERGFVRPLTCYIVTEETCTCEWCGNPEPGSLKFADGHHRLAAAIELGLKTIPLKLKRPSAAYSYDGCRPGSWQLEEVDYEDQDDELEEVAA